MDRKTNTCKYSTIIRLHQDQDGQYYIAAHPELENCFSDGNTVEEALANLDEVTTMVLEHLKEHHLPVPPPQRLFITPEELDRRRASLTDRKHVGSPRLEVRPVPA